MYKCYDCNAVFEELGQCSYHDNSPYLPDGGVTFTDVCCPECGEDNYDCDAKQCRECEQWFSDDDDFCAGLCRECAEDALTLESGIAYIEDEYNNEHNDMAKTFYVEFFMDADCKRASTELIDLCRKEWREYVKCPFVNPLDKLRDFIFDDFSAWCEWLEERDEKQKKAG